MTERVSTGIGGLDDALSGGLLPQRAYLVRGRPGCGKTALGLSFLAAASAGEATLCVTLAEPAEQLRRDAASLGIDTSGVHFLDLSPEPDLFVEAQDYDLFAPAEVERSPTARAIRQAVEERRPRRVFVDCLTHFRYLSADAYQFRRQSLSFLRFLREQGATVLFTSEHGPEAPDEDLQFLADGVLTLCRTSDGRRFLSVDKFRGGPVLTGPHEMTLDEGGMSVFPVRPPTPERDRTRVAPPLSTGNEQLDELLGGGIEPGTVTMITAPPGAGKTALGVQLLCAAARAGLPGAIYTFEEIADLLVQRAGAIGQPVGELLEAGSLVVEHVEPLHYAPEQFAAHVHRRVDEGARMVMIDSTAGYRLSVRDGDATVLLHRLCKQLQHRGVGVVLVTEMPNVTGHFRTSRHNLSYLADNLVFIRYVEVRGELKKAIGVLKKRFSSFESSLREFRITPEGLSLGPPLVHLRGILEGSASWERDAQWG